MALFNESLVGRYARLVTSLHSIKGPNPVPQISPEIVHAIVLENDRPEHRFLAGEQLWSSGAVGSGASVGNFSSVGIGNPANSGILVVITGGLQWASAASSPVANMSSALIPAVSSQACIVLDSGWSRKVALGVTGRIQNAYAAGTIQNGFDTIILTAVNVIQPVHALPIVLRPGGFVDYLQSVANQNINGIFFGYSRALEPSELTGGA